MTRTQQGIVAMIAACVLWGLSPLYYKALSHVPPLEVLSHRTLWSLVFFGIVLAVQGRLGEIGVIFRSGGLLAVMLTSSILIAINWGIFIWAIQVGRTVEASLGYYIYPLISVLLGAVLFRERLDRVQILSVALATGAVGLLTWGLGVAPWISLSLAISFVAYGVIKKQVPVGPVVSVTTEVLLLVPLAIVWLWGTHMQGWSDFDGRKVAAFGDGWFNTVMLMGLGLITAVPLILFSYAAKRLGFATQGLLFYLNPTLQFTVAVVAFGEPVSRWHMIAFPLIWLALAIYSLNALRQERALRRAAVNAGTVSTTAK